MDALTREGSQRVAVSDELICALITGQFPQYAELEVGRRYAYDHHIAVRLGDRLCINLPTDETVGPHMLGAARWITAAASGWSFAAGIPLLTGEPSEGYPFPWQIARWIPGSNASVVDLHPDSAQTLGRALHQVHTAPRRGAPVSDESVLRLADRTAEWQEALAAFGKSRGRANVEVSLDALSRAWIKATHAPIDRASTFTHGNLDPRYVISDRGDFAGICTWHTFGIGDPAADLGAALLLFPDAAAADLFSAYGGVSDAVRERANGYRLLRAIHYAVSPNPFLWRVGWARLEEFG